MTAAHIKDATLATVTAASKLGEVHALVAGNNVDAVAQAAAKIAGVCEGLFGEFAGARAPARRSGRADRGQADGEPRRVRRARDHHRQEHRAARRRLARRHADQRHPLGRGSGHLHAADLRRQRHRHGQVEGRQEGHHRPHHRVRESRGGRRLGIGRAGRCRRAIPAPAASFPPKPRKANGPS